jgi:repressor LexA
MQLTKGQQRVIQQISRLKQQLGRMPSVPELSAALGYSYQALRQHLAGLERKGLVEVVSRGQGRSSEIVPTPEGKLLLGLGIPVLGYIAAGPMTPALQQNLGLLELPSSPDTQAFVVDSDSMADFLLVGDVVVVRRVDRPPRRREICAVTDPETGRATLKYVTLQGDRVLLEPHNPEYRGFTLPARELRLLGVFEYMLRGKSPEQLLRTLGVLM